VYQVGPTAWLETGWLQSVFNLFDLLYELAVKCQESACSNNKARLRLVLRMQPHAPDM